jgi:hypothetical protein
MEGNKLTYSLLRFLIRKNWIRDDKSDDRFIIIRPHADLGFERDFDLKLPIRSNSKDFYPYIQNVINMLKEIYPNNKELFAIESFNEKYKNRHLTSWILPDTDNKIKKIGIFEVFLP